MSLYKPGDTVYVLFTTSSFTTGAATTADATPTAIMNRNGTDDGAVAVVVTNLDTGRYRAAFTVPLTYVPSDVLNLSVAATVGGVAGKAAIWHCKLGIGFVGQGTAGAGSASTITLQTALGANDLPQRAAIAIISGTGAGQVRNIAGYVNSTKVVTVDYGWTTVPDATSVYVILYGCNLATDTSGKSAASSVTGSVGSVVGSVGSVVGNVGGNINGSVANVVGNVGGSTASVSGSVGSVTGSVGSVTGSIGGDVNGKVLGTGSSSFTADGVRISSISGSVGSVTGSVGSVTGAVGSVTGNVAGDVSGKVLGGGASTIAGAGVRADSVTGSVGSVVGSVGSVTGGVIVSTNNDKTGYSLTVTPPTSAAIATAVWNSLTTDSWAANSFGKHAIISNNTNRSIGVTGAGSGHVMCDVHEMQPNVLTASALATDAVDEIWAASSRTLTAFAFTPTVGGYVTGQDPATLLFVNGSTNKLQVNPDHSVNATATVDVNAVASAVATILFVDGSTNKLKVYPDHSVITTVNTVIQNFVSIAGTIAQEYLLPQTIAARRGDTLSISLPNMGSIGSRVGTNKLVFTVKASYDDPDSAAILQVVEDIGLTVLNGNVAANATQASLTVIDPVIGSTALSISGNVTSQLALRDYVWDEQAILPTGPMTPNLGVFTVFSDVTRVTG